MPWPLGLHLGPNRRHDKDGDRQRGEQQVRAEGTAPVAVAELPGQHPAERGGLVRMRAQEVPQARERPGPVLVPVRVRVIVAMAVLMTVVVIMARAACGVHDIQDARINALPHIDKYRAPALAN